MLTDLDVTHVVCKFPYFNEIGKSDGNRTKWIASQPFSLKGIPKSQFCLMYRPSNTKDSSGLYLEPLNLDGYKSMKARVTISVQRTFAADIVKTTTIDLDYQYLDGKGWPNFFPSSAVLNSCLVANTLTVKCKFEILEGVFADTSGLDRYTSFNWKLHPFSVATKAYGLLKFEFKSAVFTIDRQRDLNLRLLLKKEPESPFVQIHLVPVEPKPFKVVLSYLIWIEDRRSGVRLPTWNKQINFDFNKNSKGCVDNQFVHVDQLHSSKSPFLTVDDSLYVHCHIYHDVLMIQQIPEVLIPPPSIKTKEDFNGSLKCPLPYYDDFKFAEIMGKYEQEAKSTTQEPKAPRLGMQELSNALGGMKKVRRQTLVEKHMATIKKIWDDYEENKRAQTKLSELPKPTEDVLAFGYLNSSEIKSPVLSNKSYDPKPFYVVEKIKKMELYSSCEIRCRAEVFEVETIDLFGKSPVIDRIASNFGAGQKLKIHLHKFCLSTVKKLVDYFVKGEVELAYFDAYDMASLANEFKMEKLKDICANKLITCLNAHRACYLLTLAIQNDMVSLADKAISTAADHVSEITNIWGWKDLCPHDKKLSLELKEYIKELSFNRVKAIFM